MDIPNSCNQVTGLSKNDEEKETICKTKSIFGDEGKEVEISSTNEIPSNNAENEDRIKILNWALESLAENQRVAFTLSKYDEMTYKEIAEIMGTTVSAIESLIHRAKTNLKKKLYKYYEGNTI
jgi:RNA polymerase sigma-70 factor (ECF subfamily)